MAMRVVTANRAWLKLTNRTGFRFDHGVIGATYIEEE